MATNQASEFIQHLRRTMLLRDGSGLSDKQLLEDFINSRDEAAMHVLLRRHGPMVWGVCRRLLNHHDAEDAFQATFLVLVRKAASITSRHLLANWLYGVAHQTALKARTTVAKRKGRERQLMAMSEPAATEQDLWRELEPLLDQELSRLPHKYRAVLVLCDLEGKTRKEAALQLGVPEGTVASRMATARAMLARRMVRHGLSVSGGALAAVLSEKVASAGVPSSMVTSTIKAASLLAAGRAAGVVSANVAALTEAVVKAMLFKKLKTASAALLTVILIGVGSGATVLIAGSSKDRGGHQPPEISPAVLIDKDDTIRPERLTLDANGGRNNPYFRKADPTNINHLWELRKSGDYYMILPKVGGGELALDANGGRNNPYFRKADPTNINHLWKITRFDACYLISPKVGEGELALNANGGRGNPYFRKADPTDNNCLWEFHKTGDYYLIVPLVRETANVTGKRDVVWGQERDGLQAGIGLWSGNARGDTTHGAVQMVVKVRNVGNSLVTIKHLADPFESFRPTVRDKDGKKLQVFMPPRRGGARLLIEKSLKPGEEVELGEEGRAAVMDIQSGRMKPLYPPQLAFAESKKKSSEPNVQVPTVYTQPGVYRVSFQGFVQTHPYLSTGELMVEFGSSGAKALKR